jgi:LuxR family maltose regulon positive regulatory protein
VLRVGLLNRIRAADSARVVTLVAPAGYGKSTLLSQWIGQESVPGAWVTVGPSHDDPALLLRHITDALTNAELLAQDVADRLTFTSSDALTKGVRELSQELGTSQSGLLVLDQLEAVRTTSGKDTLAALVMTLPPTITVAIASRSEVPVPVSTLRVKGELLELSTSDLALSVTEARELADALKVRLDDADLETVVRHTEGWPAGLYLTFLAVRSGTAPSSAAEIGGNDRFISQFLRSEVLGRLTPARRDFLRQTSVLEELSGPICDFVLERTGSERVLRSLAASSRFVVPVDRTDHSYRYHQMLREYLQAEQERSDPNLVARLNLKAADWYEQHNMPIEAVRHAIEADDASRVARLVARWSFTVFSEGHGATVLQWIDWFDAGDRLDEYPEIALLGALASAEIGDCAAVDRWMTVVDGAGDLGPLAPVVHLANALLCREDIQQCLVDARAAQEHLTPSSEWYPPSVSIEALALLWSGQTDAAHERLEVASQAAERFSSPTAAIFTLATMAMLANESGDLDRAKDLADRALHRANRPTPHQYATSIIAYVAAARSALRRGDPGQAQLLLGQAHARRPMLTRAMPVIAVQTLVEMSAVHIELADVAGARQVVRQIAAIVEQRSVGTLEERYRELRDHLDQMPTGHIGAATLTNAELRLLPLLATHLSFPEIGERLYISRHTVKTQAMSIYRKLGASSRSEAVDRAREARLLTA